MSDTAATPTSKQGKRLTVWSLTAFAGVLLILALIGVRLINNDLSPLQLDERPAEFSLTTFEGEVINSADLRGRVVLINFWASWCTTCDAEAGLLEQAWQHYQAQAGEQVIFLGVAYMDTENAARAYLGEHDVTFPNGQDLRGAISKIYQVKSVPETYILDTEGALSSQKIGPFLSLGEILTAVDEALSRTNK